MASTFCKRSNESFLSETFNKVSQHTMEKADIIIKGPDCPCEEFVGSLAEFIIPKMKAHPKDNIMQVDSLTDEKITVHEFLKLAIGVAEGLIELGLQEEDVVVLASDNCIKSHAVGLGVFFSGGALTPLNKNFKPREMEPLLAQFQPKYIICPTEKATFMRDSAKASNLDPKIILYDSPLGLNGEFYGFNDIFAEVDVTNYTPRGVTDPKKNIALISCSSGSTGLPKGVALSHFSLLYNLTVIEATEIDGLNNTILLTSPLFWISGSMFLLLTSVSGQTRYIPKSTDPVGILEGIEKFKPYFLLLSPASLLFLVEHPDFKKYNTESIKVIMVGGSVFGKSIADKAQAIWKGIIFFQGYGLTEVGGPLTLPSFNGNYLTVGSLIHEVKLKVVDVDTGESLGPNKTGECRLKTKRIMNGYYRNEKATKEAFDENGWFRTGDLVYYDEKGLLYVVGRIKEAIKFRNHQICPTEIESFLHGIPGIKDVAILPVSDPVDGHHMKALVVKHPDSDITAEFIIQSVKENFSDYKHLRKGVQFVDSLPRSEIGKLKRAEVFNMA